MSRGREIRKSLAFGLGAMLLLPVVLAIVLGLGGLLSELGDAPGATFCLRAGLFIAVLWLTSIVATVAVTAVVQVSGEAGRKPRRRRRRKERRWQAMSRREDRASGLPHQEPEPRDRSL